MKIKNLILVMVVLFTAACANDGPHKPVSSSAAGLGGAQGAGGGTPGFAQVSAVFQKNCAACHPSKQPADWMDYSTAKRYADNGGLVRRVVVERSMPDRGSPQAAAIAEAERQLIAAWVAGGAPKEATAAAPAAAGGSSSPAPGAGESVAAAPVAIQSCTSCHGTPPGGPGDASTPRLTGQSEAYLSHQLQLFARTDRIHINGPMNKIAAEMTSAQINAAAQAYAAGGPSGADAPAQLPADSRSKYERGEKLAAESCSMCHAAKDAGGRPNHPLIPVLFGQSERYLRDSLNAYRSGWRKNQEMNEYAGELSDGDIEALGYYYANATFKTRPAR